MKPPKVSEMTTDPKAFPVYPTFTQCRPIQAGGITIGGDAPLCLIAGPCVIESEEHVLRMAGELKAISQQAGVSFIFKASYDKANRTSAESFRGPGLEKGLKILERIRSEIDVPILTDVHTEEQAARAAEVCDILQIPAFLCRQTDFVHAVGKTGRAVNVKKGQFLAPWDVGNIVAKLQAAGCENILLTDRGTCFGYGSLVTDFRGLGIMQGLTGLPVCFDATHSVQEPGGLGTASGGKREYVPALSRAACGVGVNALFIETHDDPDSAKSDGPNMMPLSSMKALLDTLTAIDSTVRALHG